MSKASAKEVAVVAYQITSAANDYNIGEVRKWISSASGCHESMGLLLKFPEQKRKAAIAAGFSQWGHLSLATYGEGRSKQIRIYQVPNSSMEYRLLLEMVFDESYVNKIAGGKSDNMLVLVPIKTDSEIRYLAIMKLKPKLWRAIVTPEGISASEFPGINKYQHVAIALDN